MSRLLLINRRPEQRRVALIEGGITTELYFERVSERGVVGNIYLGRVVRVLPGMQACFVDVGLGRSGFLFVGDIARPNHDGEDLPVPGAPTASGRADRYPPISQLIHQGDRVLVQVSKAPMGTKGARLTTHISLPGRHLVYMPTIDHVGVSRRIRDADERERLRRILEGIQPEQGGLIVRTVGEGLAEDDFAEDLAFLLDLWAQIDKRAKVAKPAEMVHEDLDLTLRSVRDLLVEEGDRVVVDNDAELKRIMGFVHAFMPGFEHGVERWDSSDPMLERYGVEWEIARASRRKVWLKSGGSILLDKTEALTAVDVNTGRYVGKTSFEETVLDINMEAVKEIAYQLRLRDIGGIIVIDFIDMESEANQKRVTEALLTELSKDRARSKVLPMSRLGLVEMTRKRVRNSIVQSLTDPCFYCNGRGYLSSLDALADGVISTLHEKLRGTIGGLVELRAHPRLVECLVEDHQEAVAAVEELYQAEVQVLEAPAQHVEDFVAVVHGR